MQSSAFSNFRVQVQVHVEILAKESIDSDL